MAIKTIDSETRYTYDANRRVVEELTLEAGSITDAVSYAYDNVGNRVRVVTNDNQSTLN